MMDLLVSVAVLVGCYAILFYSWAWWMARPYPKANKEDASGRKD